MAVKKFIGFSLDPLKPLNLNDTKKWQRQGDTQCFKLIAPDLEKDRQFATAHMKAVKSYSADERLSIAGVANANIVDRMQEMLDPSGVDVENYLKNSQLLAHHSYYHPIGQVDNLEVKEDGVYFTAWIGDPTKGDLTDMQKEIRSLVAQGILKTVSVGFIPKEIKAPVYDAQSGAMTEPAVITKWELLELSIVAVPCNQDSLFSVRDYANQKTSATVKAESDSIDSLNNSLNEIQKENMVVQTLIFDKAVFSKDEAIKWAKDHKFSTDNVDETDNGYRLRQDDPSNFDQSSFRTIDITKGVQAVAGKINKDGAAVDPNTTDPDAQQDADMMKAIQGIADGMKKIGDVCDAIAKKLDVAAAADSGSDAGGDATPPADPNAGKALDSRIEKIEKSIERLAQALNLVVEKIKK